MKLPKIVSHGPKVALIAIVALSSVAFAQNSDADYWNNLADGNIVPSVPQVIADTTPLPVVDVAPQPLQEALPPPVVEEAPRAIVDVAPQIAVDSSEHAIPTAESIISSTKPLTAVDSVPANTKPTRELAEPAPAQAPKSSKRKKLVADPFLVQTNDHRKYQIDPQQELRFQSGRNIVYRGGWVAVGGLVLHLAGYAGNASEVVLAGATISTVGVLISGIGYGRMTDTYNNMYPEDKRRRGGWGWFWTGAAGVALSDLVYIAASENEKDDYSYSSQTYEEQKKDDQSTAAVFSSVSEGLVMIAWLQFVSGSSKLNKAFTENHVQAVPILSPERQGLQVVGSF